MSAQTASPVRPAFNDFNAPAIGGHHHWTGSRARAALGNSHRSRTSVQTGAAIREVAHDKRLFLSRAGEQVSLILLFIRADIVGVRSQNFDARECGVLLEPPRDEL